MKQEESSALDQKNSPYDSLTGLYHLDTFKTNIKQYLKERDSGSHLALLYTDIAHFERINNLYGRNLADSLLLELSQSISKIDFGLRLYCRSVADHFVILVKFEEKEKLDHDLQRFCNEFNRLALERFPEAVPRLGIGAFIIYDTSEPIDDMVEKANAARKSLRGRSSVRVAYTIRLILESTGGPRSWKRTWSMPWLTKSLRCISSPNMILLRRRWWAQKPSSAG